MASLLKTFIWPFGYLWLLGFGNISGDRGCFWPVDFAPKSPVFSPFFENPGVGPILPKNPGGARRIGITVFSRGKEEK